MYVINRHLLKLSSVNHWPIESANAVINYLISAPRRVCFRAKQVCASSRDKCVIRQWLNIETAGGLGPRKSQYKMAETSGNPVETG